MPNILSESDLETHPKKPPVRRTVSDTVGHRLRKISSFLSDSRRHSDEFATEEFESASSQVSALIVWIHTCSSHTHLLLNLIPLVGEFGSRLSALICSTRGRGCVRCVLTIMLLCLKCIYLPPHHSPMQVQLPSHWIVLQVHGEGSDYAVLALTPPLCCHSENFVSEFD